MVAPASLEGSFIDQELSANLDSTFAFEGPEKLLEIWFYDSEEDITGPKEGLRLVPLDAWVKVLDIVQCKILSKKSSAFMDAYLLSESSFFVFPHKLILKTCGTTTTLACIEELFSVVRQYLQLPFENFDSPRIFYSRRAFMFPEKQKHVHSDWKLELNHLRSYFSKGKSYIVGNCMEEDHWYLFLAGTSRESNAKFKNGRTFEILMSELDQDSMKQFYADRIPGSASYAQKQEDGFHLDLGHEFGNQMMEKSGLNRLFDDFDKGNEIDHVDSDKSRIHFKHDAFSFYPCGFSSNSISFDQGAYYYTLHITPESGWSYASFETNYPFTGSNDKALGVLLERILSIFKPGRFSATFISQADDGFNGIIKDATSFDYRKNDKIVHDLQDGFKLLYLNCTKN